MYIYIYIYIYIFLLGHCFFLSETDIKTFFHASPRPYFDHRPHIWKNGLSNSF